MKMTQEQLLADHRAGHARFIRERCEKDMVILKRITNKEELEAVERDLRNVKSAGMAIPPSFKANIAWKARRGAASALAMQDAETRWAWHRVVKYISNVINHESDN